MVRRDPAPRSLTIAASTATTLLALLVIAAGGPAGSTSVPAGTPSATWVDAPLPRALAAIVAAAARDCVVTPPALPVAPAPTLERPLPSRLVTTTRVRPIADLLGPRRLDLPPPLV